MNVYICGAVKDILDEFELKLSRHGVTVIAADEWTHRHAKAYSIPLAADAVIIGTDQQGHSASTPVVLQCKARGLRFAVGPLRKWSFIYPKLVQAGILRA